MRNLGHTGPQAPPPGQIPRSRGRGRARCQQPRVRSSSGWTHPPSPPRPWSSTRRPDRWWRAGRHRTPSPPGRAARAIRGSGGTRSARRCTSAARRPTRPPRCRSAASSTGSSPSTPRAIPYARPCCGTTCARRHRPVGWSRSWAARRPGPNAPAACPAPPSRSRSGPGWPSTNPTPSARPRPYGCPTTTSPNASRERARPIAAMPPVPAGGRPVRRGTTKRSSRTSDSTRRCSPHRPARRGGRNRARPR